MTFTHALDDLDHLAKPTFRYWSRNRVKDRWTQSHLGMPHHLFWGFTVALASSSLLKCLGHMKITLCQIPFFTFISLRLAISFFSVCVSLSPSLSVIWNVKSVDKSVRSLITITELKVLRLRIVLPLTCIRRRVSDSLCIICPIFWRPEFRF